MYDWRQDEGVLTAHCFTENGGLLEMYNKHNFPPNLAQKPVSGHIWKSDYFEVLYMQ